MSMVGYVITVNPWNNKVSWEGIVSEFELTFSGVEIASSTVKCKGFTGNIDDLFVLIPIDGFGKLKSDTRAKIENSAGVGFYYGIVTSYAAGIVTEVTCSDVKRYMNSDCVLAPVKKETYNNDPFEWMVSLYTNWIYKTPMVMSKATGRNWPSAGDFKWDTDLKQPSTETLSEKFLNYFKDYQVTFIPSGDYLRLDSAERNTDHPGIKTQDTSIEESPYKLLCISPIYGDHVGSLVIDNSINIRKSDVYVRPLMNGEPTGIHIVIPDNYNSPDKSYQSLTTRDFYITNKGNIVQDPDFFKKDSSGTEHVEKPIKMVTTVYQEDPNNPSSAVQTDSNGTTIFGYISVNWSRVSKNDTNNTSTIKYNITANVNGKDAISFKNVTVSIGCGSPTTVVLNNWSGTADSNGTTVVTDTNITINHNDRGELPLFIKVTGSVGGASFTKENSFDLPRCFNDKTLTAIAKDTLKIPDYSHEIKFEINKRFSSVNDICKIGNRVSLKYKTKTYESIVREFKVDSNSDWISVVCGNLSSSLADAITTGSAGSSSSSSSTGGSSGSGGGSGKDVEEASNFDIDFIISRLNFN